MDVSHASVQHTGDASDAVAVLHQHVEVGQAQILHVVHRGEQAAARAALRGIGHMRFHRPHHEVVDAVAKAGEAGAEAGHEAPAGVPCAGHGGVDIRAQRSVHAAPLQAVGVVAAGKIGAHAGDDGVVDE